MSDKHFVLFDINLISCLYSISFKRKQKQRSGLSLSGLSNIFSRDSDRNINFDRTTSRNGRTTENDSQPASESFQGNGLYNAQKEGGLLDWYVEGPGRRVGYDDFTAIDWIFEYTKERQRKRLLSASGQGMLGYAHKLYDASNVWLVLVATGILVGIIAAFIDVVSDWLGDIKAGYCKNGPGGGKFYLNRSFCCWGHEQGKLPGTDSPISFLTLFLVLRPFKLHGLGSLGEGCRSYFCWWGFCRRVYFLYTLLCWCFRHSPFTAHI